jgi:hypothetical protein
VGFASRTGSRLAFGFFSVLFRLGFASLLDDPGVQVWLLENGDTGRIPGSSAMPLLGQVFDFHRQFDDFLMDVIGRGRIRRLFRVFFGKVRQTFLSLSTLGDRCPVLPSLHDVALTVIFLNIILHLLN